MALQFLYLLYARVLTWWRSTRAAYSSCAATWQPSCLCVQAPLPNIDGYRGHWSMLLICPPPASPSFLPDRHRGRLTRPLQLLCSWLLGLLLQRMEAGASTELLARQRWWAHSVHTLPTAKRSSTAPAANGVHRGRQTQRRISGNSVCRRDLLQRLYAVERVVALPPGSYDGGSLLARVALAVRVTGTLPLLQLVLASAQGVAGSVGSASSARLLQVEVQQLAVECHIRSEGACAAAQADFFKADVRRS